jgi:hypothetical protein
MKNEHRFVRIACFGSGSNQFCNVYFDLDTKQNATGATSGLWLVSSTSVVDISDGWSRYIMTFSPSMSGTTTIDIGSQPNRTPLVYTGNNVNGTTFWGIQLEIGQSTTEYIPIENNFQW